MLLNKYKNIYSLFKHIYIYKYYSCMNPMSIGNSKAQVILKTEPNCKFE